MTLTAAEIIRVLDLKPHPEGGHYRETFRDDRTHANGRAHSTAIYFLLARGSARTGTRSMRRRPGTGMRAPRWRCIFQKVRVIRP
jgi:predicted cupin superfamily sugar epimerase